MPKFYYPNGNPVLSEVKDVYDDNGGIYIHIETTNGDYLQIPLEEIPALKMLLETTYEMGLEGERIAKMMKEEDKNDIFGGS